MIFFFFIFLIEHRTVILLVKKIDFFVYMWYHFFRLSFWSVLTFFFNSRWGWGRYFLRGTIWRYFLIVRESKNVGFFGNTKISSPFSSRALRYFGLLSCNWALRHIESIENQNVVIVFGQSNDVALRGNLQATAPRYFHLK